MNKGIPYLLSALVALTLSAGWAAPVLALFEHGRVTGFRGAERDVTERREQEDRIARLTRVLQMLSGINSLVPRIRDRKELLQEACRLAVKTGGYAHAVVMLQKSGAQGVQPAAWFGVDTTRTDMLCAALAENARHVLDLALLVFAQFCFE